MRTAAKTDSAEALLTELRRTQQELAAAERRARTYLAREGVLDQTRRDVRALLQGGGRRRE